MFMRISFGLCLALIGIDHIKNMAEFAPTVSGGFGFLDPVAPLAIWLVSVLEVVGGLWFAIDVRSKWPGLLVGLALMLIAVGMTAKTLLGGVPLMNVMDATQNSLLWLTFALVILGFSSCKDSSK
jgi:uncharacterized membrane protein YphA (DoxX/SURF4 family)